MTNPSKMTALRIISAWAILLHIRTGKCKFLILESSHRNASHITGHPWGESTGKQWTTCKGGNGAWAGHMCFCVYFCGVFVCIWGHFYVHLGGVSWAIYGCFVCILVNFVTRWVSKYYITSVYDIMWLIYLRPGWRNTFPPFDTYWINNVTNV